MPPLPDYVLACPATMSLILRAQAGELARVSYHEAWDGLGREAAEAYHPSEQVEKWMRLNWPSLFPAAPDGAGVASVPVVESVAPVVFTPPILTEDWMQPFLDEYKVNGNITQASKAGPIHRKTVYEYLKHDPEFSRAFEEAEVEYKDTIRSTIKRRSIDGWEEPVFGRMDKVEGGKVICETVIVGYVRKHDNRLLIRMAESALEEYAKTKEGPNININNTASASAAAAVLQAPEKLKSLQARKRRQLEKAAQRGQLVQP